MLPVEIIRQIRRLQIQARRAVDSLLGGEYHSVFKGTGIAFEEVRAYSPGDDIRAIDWNVTARMGQPFIKRFVEERELTVMVLIDFSGSQQFGTTLKQKREVAAELAALIAFTAISNSDRVGLVLFTDQVEKYVPPHKGSRHGLRLIRDALYFQPTGLKTSIQTALNFLGRVLRRRCIMFLISDFLDKGFETALKRAGRRHDVIALRIIDPSERQMPAMDLIELEDAETGNRVLLDARNRSLRSRLGQLAKDREATLQQTAKRGKVDLVEVSTEGNHLESLLRFFKMRERRLRRS